MCFFPSVSVRFPLRRCGGRAGSGSTKIRITINSFLAYIFQNKQTPPAYLSRRGFFKCALLLSEKKNDSEKLIPSYDVFSSSVFLNSLKTVFFYIFRLTAALTFHASPQGCLGMQINALFVYTYTHWMSPADAAPSV